VEALQWVRARGCPWDPIVCSLAAVNDHLDALQWARANGCPWDDRTCLFAADGGNLEVLQWARANGCPWDAEQCRRKALAGSRVTRPSSRGLMRSRPDAGSLGRTGEWPGLCAARK